MTPILAWYLVASFLISLAAFGHWVLNRNIGRKHFDRRIALSTADGVGLAGCGMCIAGLIVCGLAGLIEVLA